MTIWERTRGIDAAGAEVAGKLSPHFYTGLLEEVNRGEILVLDALSAITTVTGVALDATEISQSNTLITALNPPASLTRAELDDVLNLAEVQSPPYDVEANFNTRLGL